MTTMPRFSDERTWRRSRSSPGSRPGWSRTTQDRGRPARLVRPRLNRSYAGFTLDPSDPDGQTLLTARHDVRLTPFDGGTDVELTVTPADVRAGADAAGGGPAIGGEQLLDTLAALARHDGLRSTGHR